jgi:hypothetical protein
LAGVDQALVRTVVIEMAHVAIKNSSGVSLVVAQQSVGHSARTLPMNCSA